MYLRNQIKEFSLFRQFLHEIMFWFVEIGNFNQKP